MREYYLRKNLSDYERTRQALISAYDSKPFWKADAVVKRVLWLEEKQITGNQNVIANDLPEHRGRKKPVFNEKRK